MLKSYFPKIDLSYIKQNVSSSKAKASKEEKLAQIHSQLGHELTQELYEKNHYDMLTYELAQEILSENIAKIQGFKQKLDEFKQRSRNLQ